MLGRIWHPWKRWIQIAITLILFAYLMSTAPVGAAWQQIHRMRPMPALFSLALILISLTMFAYMWAMTLRGLDISVPFRRVLSLFFQSLFVNNFASFTGGDLVRGYKLGRATRQPVDVGVSVLVSRLIMLYTLLLLAGVSTWWFGPRAGWSEEIRWVGYACTVMLLLVLVAYRWPLQWLVRQSPKHQSGHSTGVVRQTVEALLRIGSQQGAILIICLGSLLAQLASLWAVWWMSVALQMSVTLWQILLALSVLRIVMVLPISFNGLGLREVGLVSILSGMGILASDALALALATSLLAVASSLPGGLLLLKDSLGPGLGPTSQFGKP